MHMHINNKINNNNSSKNNDSNNDNIKLFEILNSKNSIFGYKILILMKSSRNLYYPKLKNNGFDL